MLNELSLPMILQAWGVRIGVTALGLALGVAIIGADQLPVAELAIQRLLALPVSMPSASASRPGCASTRSAACPTCARSANACSTIGATTTA
ncbi:hypothetical protein G6F50_017824 [Rhizopus delemar]|uniref:Uncharacterized protein n=1 Tax=Rhizopus delemar TaxID=936053 RepID=A0A9P7BZ87_9FUNG|nr:hypothetical protein G6F50_017824 [Rhizopus delemar]